MVDKKRKVRKNGLNTPQKRKKLKMYLVFPKKAFETSFSEDMFDNMAILNFNMDEKRKQDYIR